jgi:hypothetical protein
MLHDIVCAVVSCLMRGKSKPSYFVLHVHMLRDIVDTVVSWLMCGKWCGLMLGLMRTDRLAPHPSHDLVHCCACAHAMQEC